jgi:Carboxypeptidase regulatory-like domain
MKRSLFLLSGAALGAVLALPSVQAGGSEVYCFGGNEIVERWMTPTVTFEVRMINSLFFATGYPVPNFCLPPSGIQPGAEEVPGIQSLVRAANAWSVDSPLNPGTPYSGMTLQYGGVVPNKAMVGDSQNLITLQDSIGLCVPFGGSFVLAFTQGSRIEATGALQDVDVIVNAPGEVCGTATGGGNNQPGYSFVEFNDAWQQWFATTTADTSVGEAFLAPVLGYADLQGVVTHELGHVLGFGHSLVESNVTPISSQVPTMFFMAQAEGTFSETAEVYDGCTNVQTVQIDGSTTLTGGILGRSARTPEWDDRVTVGTTYPGPDFAASYGSISGAITDSSGVAQVGAHVVAVSSTDPVNLRVGTLSRAGGAYTIAGLPPGRYYLQVESIDVDFNSSGLDSGFFPESTLPEYLSSCTSPGALPSFASEYWDLNEGLGELSLAADTITVSASTPSTGINVVVGGGFGDDLTVRNLAQPIFDPSIRGVILAPLKGSDPTVELRVRASVTDTVLVVFGTTRTAVKYQGQLIEVPIAGPGFLTSVTLGPGGPSYDVANGEYVFSGTITDSFAYLNMYAQAGILDGSGQPKLTNTVTTMITTP